MFNNLSFIEQSYSVAFADFVRLREREGHTIVKMQTGDPDFPTHTNVVKAAEIALDRGETKYCDSKGLLSLRQAISEKLALRNGIIASPEDNILVTHGAVHGISMAIRAIVNQGDECIIIEPYWRSYQSNVILAGGVPVIIQTLPEKGFQLDAEAILNQITSKTRLIIINTPNNPSGAVYRKEELIKLANGAAKRKVYIISDEVYEALTFERNHYSIASDPDVREWIISAFSFSKTYAMTGWRIGYIAASKMIIDGMLKLSQFGITSLSPYNQLAAIAALNDETVQAYAEVMRKEYEKRRNIIKHQIEDTWLKDVITIPEGTFYVLIEMGKFGISSLDLAKRIVHQSGVSFTPGIAFGDSMDGYLRMCFATDEKNINIAIKALLDFKEGEGMDKTE